MSRVDSIRIRQARYARIFNGSLDVSNPVDVNYLSDVGHLALIDVPWLLEKVGGDTGKECHWEGRYIKRGGGVMKRDLLELELRKGHHRLVLRKVSPGPLLKAVHGAFSFFYEVTIDGSVRCHTNDASVAQSVWRGAHRWLFTGRSSTAEVLP